MVQEVTMIGLSKQKLINEIESEYGSFGHYNTAIKRQDSLDPADTLNRLVAGVVKAIEANNKAIELQLKQLGVNK
jgi:hypothetical protein